MAAKPYKARSWAVVPDTQVKAGVPTEHLAYLGQYLVEKQPEVILCLGDWFDMPSLSSYDTGKKSFEGRMYKTDIEAGKAAMARMMEPIKAAKGYKPRLVFTLGNHEQRIERAVESDRKLEGTIGYHDLGLEAWGWEVHDFLDPVTIDGITACHFFPRSASGAVMQTKRGASSAKTQLQREGRSCIAGHQQGLELHCMPLGGCLQWGIIAGSFYQHNEAYLSPMGNQHWRGFLMLHEVNGKGGFDPMPVSLNFLLRKYGRQTTSSKR